MRDNEGCSPLDIAMDKYSNKGAGCVDTAYYLMKRGCGDDHHKTLLLLGACRWGKLDMVKELVEQHRVNPNGESVNQHSSACYFNVRMC